MPQGASHSLATPIYKSVTGHLALLEPGEEVLASGLARCRTPLPGFPDSADAVFVALTSTRVLLVPVPRQRALLSIPWNAVSEVTVPRPLLLASFRHYLDLALGPTDTIKLAFTSDTTAFTSQREFCERAGAIAIERSASARSLGPPTPRFRVVAWPSR